MRHNELADPFDRLLNDVSAPSRVRAIEASRDIGALWAAVADSGYLDALVPEDDGGAGLALREIEPLIEALGAHATPAPIAETMVARALLMRAGVAPPDGPIVLATTTTNPTRPVPLAGVAGFALLDDAEHIVLIDLASNRDPADSSHSSLAARITIAKAGQRLPRPARGLRDTVAVLRAAQIAGAGRRLLDMTLAYANDRVQFGKPIGKQQAVQQQLSVMAERMVATRMAAQIGCDCQLLASPRAAATAKCIASAAAVDLAAIAHAVHGAIGISEEHDLSLYVRRLYEWRLSEGSESYWATRLGTDRVDSTAETSLDFVRAITDDAD